MLAALVVAALTAAVIAWIVLPPWWRHRRRASLAEQPLPADWRRILRRQLPLYERMAPDMRRRLEAQINIFLAEKRFHGCAGFAVDDIARLTIAGHACLLALQPDAPGFPEVHEILIYPSAFWVQHAVPDEAGLVDESPELLAGEAWDAGRVILSWEDVTAAVAGAEYNVVVHEFAHQLDFAAPGAVGAPPLADYADWSAVFSAAFADLRAAGSPVLDMYGAENPAEFFAVASETYFQRGTELARHHPALYRRLRDFYRIDTAD